MSPGADGTEHTPRPCPPGSLLQAIANRLTISSLEVREHQRGPG